jgi:quercetin 2,3-dioxygenase
MTLCFSVCNFASLKTKKMNRKEFLKKSILGSSVAVSANTVAADIPRKKAEADVVGFNHLPNKTAKIMENTVLHRAADRGHANHGWLDSHHSFSFANYYNPERMHFGVLRVLNDDIIAGGRGFGTHPHDNMEIISIPIEGGLAHKDSMGNEAVIQQGDVQVMSAGTGIFHSEFNHSPSDEARFLQIWMFPNKRNVTPRYDQITMNIEDRHNKFQQVLSPSKDDEGVWVHQNAWFNLGRFDKNFKVNYQVKSNQNGVYAFVIKGNFTVNGQELGQRDALGVWNTAELNIEAQTTDAEILLMDVPMQLS